MTCDELRERLDDRIDGDLEEPAASAVSAHLATCEACRAEEAARRALQARIGALPRALDPSRDLWPGIRAAIERPATSSERRDRRRLVPLVAAAAVVFAAGLLAGILLRVDRDAGVPVAGAGGVGGPTAVLASYDALDARYAAARDELVSEIEARRDEIDPETLSVVLDNLALMDRAAARIRAALEREPGNPALQKMLIASYQRRVDLLHQVVDVAVRM